MLRMKRIEKLEQEIETLKKPIDKSIGLKILTTFYGDDIFNEEQLKLWDTDVESIDLVSIDEVGDYRPDANMYLLLKIINSQSENYVLIHWILTACHSECETNVYICNDMNITQDDINFDYIRSDKWIDYRDVDEKKINIGDFVNYICKYVLDNYAEDMSPFFTDYTSQDKSSLNGSEEETFTGSEEETFTGSEEEN